MPLGPLFNHIFYGKASIAAIGGVTVVAVADFNNNSSFSASSNVSVTGDARMDKIRLFSAQGNVSVTSECVVKVRSKVIATGDVGAQPTAFEVAQTVILQKIEGDYTLRDAIRVLTAVAAGKTEVSDLGGGTAEVVFRSITDTDDRVTANMTGSERTSVSINT